MRISFESTSNPFYMREREEIVKTIRAIADRIEGDDDLDLEDEHLIKDGNGNVIGEFHYVETTDDL